MANPTHLFLGRLIHFGLSNLSLISVISVPAAWRGTGLHFKVGVQIQEKKPKIRSRVGWNLETCYCSIPWSCLIFLQFTPAKKFTVTEGLVEVLCWLLVWQWQNSRDFIGESVIKVSPSFKIVLWGGWGLCAFVLSLHSGIITGHSPCEKSMQAPAGEGSGFRALYGRSQNSSLTVI